MGPVDPGEERGPVVDDVRVGVGVMVSYVVCVARVDLNVPVAELVKLQGAQMYPLRVLPVVRRDRIEVKVSA
jgi:hypothetical protein